MPRRALSLTGRRNELRPSPELMRCAACSRSMPCSDAKRSSLFCNRSVAIEPGLIALTRTPSFKPRSASAFVRLSNAALTEPPIANSALPVRPPMPDDVDDAALARFQMRPRSAATSHCSEELQRESVTPYSHPTS